MTPTAAEVNNSTAFDLTLPKGVFNLVLVSGYGVFEAAAAIRSLTGRLRMSLSSAALSELFVAAAGPGERSRATCSIACWRAFPE